jgi:hypothetical protein
MSARNRIAVRQLLLKILKDDRTPAHRKSLKGALEARTRCIQRANEYLNLLKMTPVPQRVSLPVSLNRTVAECRKVAGSIRLGCNARMEAIEKLLYLEGLEVPQTDSPTWALIHRELGTKAPEPEVSSHDPAYLKNTRAAARRACLKDIQLFMLDNADALRGLSIEEIANRLRLPENKETAPEVLSEESKLKIQDALARLGGK